MKDEIRAKLKIKRKYFQYVRREQADIFILQNFLAAFAGYESFFIYNSIKDEADTKNLIAELLCNGKKVYLPRTEGENIVPVLYGETKKGAFGIDEPQGQAFNGKIDITVVPLLAVNDRGFRIGYGGGYYDRYLKNSHTKKVGLGYYFQIENFEEDEWDVPLDCFVCEKGIYYYGN